MWTLDLIKEYRQQEDWPEVSERDMETINTILSNISLYLSRSYSLNGIEPNMVFQPEVKPHV